MARLLPPERDIGVLHTPVRSCLALVGAFVLVVLALGLLERIGIEAGAALTGVIGAAIALFVFAALLSHSRRAVDFYVADRRISGAFGGLVSAASFAGLLALGLAGSVFRSQAELLTTVTGLAAGYFILAAIIAPGLRGLGAYTPGDFLATRFGGSWTRLVWAAVAFSASFLLLIAVLKIAAALLTSIFGLAPQHALYAAAGLMAMAGVPGGMRSLSWTQAIQYFVIALALIVAAGFIVQNDSPSALSAIEQAASAFFATLPEWDGLGGLQSLLPIVFIALGAASLPHHVTRALTAEPGRRSATSMTWGVFFGAVLVLLGVVLGELLLGDVAVDFTDGPMAVFTSRLAGLSAVVAGLALAGTLAALLAIGQAVLFAAATALSHDVWDEIVDKRGPEGRRIVVARVILAGVAALAAAIVPMWSADTPALFAWALALAAAGGFVPLALGIWWRRCNEIGALGGMVAGFGFAGLVFLMSQGLIPTTMVASDWTKVGAPAAAMAGVAISLIVTIGLSVVTPSPEADARTQQTSRASNNQSGPPIRERPA